MISNSVFCRICKKTWDGDAVKCDCVYRPPADMHGVKQFAIIVASTLSVRRFMSESAWKAEQRLMASRGIAVWAFRYSPENKKWFIVEVISGDAAWGDRKTRGGGHGP